MLFVIGKHNCRSPHSMMGAGVFERYPRLKVSAGESGAGWLAYALHRMDFEFADRFRDRCKTTLQFDPISAELIEEIGVETMMWGSASGQNPRNTSRSNSPASLPKSCTRSPAKTPPNSTA